jgi:hypothetical protein
VGVIKVKSDNNEGMITLKDWALGYAEAGFPVFPIKENAKKPPLTAHGFKDASTSQVVVERWWDRYPNANIAIATGGKWAVVDVDPRNEGSVPEWVPSTWTASTPAGGRHYWLRMDRPVRSRVLARGVDLKAEGGYVVVPPSKRPEGEYEWVIDLSPAWIEADALESRGITRAVGEGGPLDGTASGAPFEPKIAREGERHEELTKWARATRAEGKDYAQIMDVIYIANEVYCKPPIEDEDELRRIGRWASRLRLED